MTGGALFISSEIHASSVINPLRRDMSLYTGPSVYHGQPALSPSRRTFGPKRERIDNELDSGACLVRCFCQRCVCVNIRGIVSTSDRRAKANGWKRLDDDNEWKQFADYWSKQDFQTTFKGSTIPLAYNEKGKEDPRYRLRLAPRSKNVIMIRDCYRPLYAYALNTLRNEDINGLVLTGQPGTGAF